jgi:hypothetical protein
MSKKKYECSVTATVEVDEDLIKTALEKEWRETFYDFHTPEEVVAFIAYNLIHNNIRLTQIDGFADKNDNQAKIIGRATLDPFEGVREVE